jgi:signal transduction histidine kinase
MNRLGRWRQLLSDRFLAGAGLAFVLFVAWQFFNHYFLMEYLMAQLGMSMLFYHYLSLVVEILLAGVIALFASRAILQKSRELEELGRQKDALAGALVHDLRQPLTAVLGGLASAANDPEIPARTRELVEIAHSGADELLDMVNDLLDVTRLEAGKPLFEPKPVRPSAFIERGVARVAELARERSQQLRVDLPDGLPEVAGDQERLTRVVSNLVGNAVKFTPAGGSIRVSARQHESTVEVSVSDSGPGIPRGFQRRIFDRFASLSSASSSGRASTGLGLTFCKLTVEAHGGRIWVESQLGQGSIFTFSLPTSSGARPPRRQP